MTEPEFQELLTRYQQGLCTADEKELLERWLDSDTRAKAFTSDTERKKILSNLRNAVFERVGLKGRDKRERVLMPHDGSRGLRTMYRIAASLLLIALVGYGSYKFMYQNETSSAEVLTTSDIKPGSDKAVLKLADGTEVELNGVGTSIPQQGIAQIVSQNGQLSYQAKGTTSELIYNTVSTPRGGQYQLTLADGSKVWLNAASSLKFPASFTGSERVVELQGEAYFEIAKNKTMPFRVRMASGDEVRVLGTHFNVMAYPDEKEIKTTLLEGSVKILTSKGMEPDVILAPNQQAIISSGGNLSVLKDYNVNEAVAWKTGNFIFNDTRLEVIMRQVERWYDVDVIYDDSLRNMQFGGMVSRKENVTELLNLLELTGEVHFEIQGRNIVVKNVK